MRIVIKPLGLVSIVGAIILLSFLAFRSTLDATRKPPVSMVSVRDIPEKPGIATSQPELTVYANGLENGWQERGWAKVIDYGNMSPVRGGGGTSIRGETVPYDAVKIYNPVARLASYNYLVLFLHGGEAGGQVLTLATVAGGRSQKGIALPPLPAGQWVRVVVPMERLGIQGRDDVYAFWLQNNTATATEFCIDDVQFLTTPPGSVTETTLSLPPDEPAS